MFPEALEFAKMAMEVLALAVTFTAFLISYRGYSITRRPVFARLSFAFMFLAVNFMLQLLSDTLKLMEYSSLSYYSNVASSFFEMLGFFFIAVSHMIKVSQERKLASLALIIINPIIAFKTLSLYFIFYAILESTLSYCKVRSKTILITVLGLAGFALNTILTWVSEFVSYPIPLQVSALAFQTVGVIAFSVPIWIYYRSVR